MLCSILCQNITFADNVVDFNYEQYTGVISTRDMVPKHLYLR